jgi:CRISPR-associated protein Csm3
MKMNKIQLKQKIKIDGTIEILTGIHIGGSSSTLEIGGIDANVIKKANGEPYIPGSSLKGKLRYLLELQKYPLIKKDDLLDADEKNNLKKASLEVKNKILRELHNKYPQGYFSNSIHTFFDPTYSDSIIKIFGNSADATSEISGPTRLIVRDSDLIQESIFEDVEKKEHNEKFKSLELTYTESKWENTINRVDSSANPRQLERVPVGAKFKFEFIFNVFDDNDGELLKELISAMELLEDDYLGGSGTRGYGKVKFRNITLTRKDVKRYGEDEDVKPLVKDADDLSTLKKDEKFKELIKNVNQNSKTDSEE